MLQRRSGYVRPPGVCCLFFAGHIAGRHFPWGVKKGGVAGTHVRTARGYDPVPFRARLGFRTYDRRLSPQCPSRIERALVFVGESI